MKRKSIVVHLIRHRKQEHKSGKIADGKSGRPG